MQLKIFAILSDEHRRYYHEMVQITNAPPNSLPSVEMIRKNYVSQIRPHFGHFY